MNASRIKYIKDLSELTQQEFASSIGITVMSYKNYETGKRSISSGVAQQISEVYEVSTDFIFGLTNIPYKDTTTFILDIVKWVREIEEDEHNLRLSTEGFDKFVRYAIKHIEDQCKAKGNLLSKDDIHENVVHLYNITKVT